MSAAFVSPSSWDDAVAEKAARPELVPIAGGTGVLPELAAGGHLADGHHGFPDGPPPPVALLDLTRIHGGTRWYREHDTIRIGSTMSYTQIIAELGAFAPGLVAASRTVGSPQIRNRGTLGGNLGTAAADGDATLPLLAAGAAVEIASVRGLRQVPLTEFVTTAGRPPLEPDELIHSVRVPVAVGPEEFAKVGRRTTMTRSICALSIALDAVAGTAGVAVGAAAPVPLRAGAAEAFLAAELAGQGLWTSRADLGEPLLRHFGDLVAAAAVPVTDLRGPAGYRRQMLAVLGRRLLERAWRRHQDGSWPASRQAADTQGASPGQEDTCD